LLLIHLDIKIFKYVHIVYNILARIVGGGPLLTVLFSLVLYVSYHWQFWLVFSFMHMLVFFFIHVHHVSKNKQNCFCYNYVKLPPNLTIFGRKMAKGLKLYEVH